MNTLISQEPQHQQQWSWGSAIGFSYSPALPQIPYIWKRRADGLYIINLAKTWEKLMLAARIVVAIENPADGAPRSPRIGV